MIKNEEQFISFLTSNYDSINKIPKNWLGIGDDAAIIDIDSQSLIFCGPKERGEGVWT